MNSTDYLHMLELFAAPQMAHFQANNFFFQQDSAPPHWGPTVRESLNKIVQVDWVGWTNPLAPCTSEITPLDFFLLGLCKGPGISSKVGSMVELHTQINSAAASMTPQMLENT
jgi:hypothetical protein